MIPKKKIEISKTILRQYGEFYLDFVHARLYTYIIAG